MKDYYENIYKNYIEHPRLYSRLLNKKWDNRLQKILKIVQPYIKGRVLDIGCSSGEIANMIFNMPNISKIEGVDISEIAIKEAKRRYPQIAFKQCSTDKLLYEDLTFDTIFAGELIEHVPDTNRMFKEFYRVLKGNGILIITTPEMTTLKSIIISLFYYDQYYNPTGEHVRFYTKNSITKILKSNGFKIIQIYHERPIIHRLMIIIAKRVNKK